MNVLFDLSDYIRDFGLEWQVWVFTIILPLTLCFIISGLIGLERQNVGKAAGFSAHVLVGLSACGLAIMQQLMVINPAVGTITQPESQRVIAQVISGVGFIGAGVILKDPKGAVRGITTAATIWACASIGILAGSGFLFNAALLGIVIVAFIYIRDLKRGVNPFIHIPDEENPPIKRKKGEVQPYRLD